MVGGHPNNGDAGNIVKLKIRHGERELTLKGRVAWALDNLVRAGEGGCTPITHPGPRWSDCVFKLRRDGIPIETNNETHRGAYAGHHARYVLRSPVEILETESRP